jgi:beta-galactosidase
MISIANNWNAQSPTDITVYSNCEEVALYLNDSLIKKITPTINAFSDALPHPPFLFSIDHFVSGELKAVGYINGKAVTKDIVKTAKQAKKIKLSVDLSGIPIHKTQPDVVFVYAKVVDEEGNIFSDATNEIEFELKGNQAELIGSNPIKAEAGIATILLKTNSLPIPISITASAATLTSDNIQIK